MSATVYHAIRKCEDYRPSPCKDPTCEYLSPCPDFLCQSPEKNKDYVDQQKVATKAALDEIDSLLLDGKVFFIIDRVRSKVFFIIDRVRVVLN